MTRSERLKLNAKSMLAYGNELKWQRVMKKGHLMVDKIGRRWYPISLTMIEEIMNQLIKAKGEKKHVDNTSTTGNKARSRKANDATTKSSSTGENG